MSRSANRSWSSCSSARRPRSRSCSRPAAVAATAAAAAAAAAAGVGSHAHAAAPLSLPKSRAYWRWSGEAPFEAGARTPLRARAICVGRRGRTPGLQPPRAFRRPRTSSTTDAPLFSPRRRGCRRTASGVQLLLCSKECRRLTSGRRCLAAVAVWQAVPAARWLVCRPTIASVIAVSRSQLGHRSLSAGQIILSAIIALAEQTKKIANSRDQRTTPRIQQMRSCVFDKFCSFHE